MLLITKALVAILTLSKIIGQFSSSIAIPIVVSRFVINYCH